MIALLLRYWQAGIIAALVIFGWAQWSAHNRAEREKGAAEVRWHIADSTLKVLAVQQRKVDSVFRTDTLRFTKWRDSVSIRHDTVLAHLTDTLTVRTFIQVQDSAIASCTALLSSCKARGDNLEQQLQQERTKVTVAPLVAQRSCLPSNSVVGLLGVGIGVLIGRK